VIECLNALFENVNLSIFTEKMNIIIDKILDFSENSDHHQSKLEICKLFQIIAVKLKNFEDKNFINKFNQNYFEKILSKIELYCQDRVHKVQILAKETLSEWNSLKTIQNGTQEPSNNKFADRSNKLNLLRSMSKINKAKCISPDNIKSEIYNKGIGVLMKTANFLTNRELSSSKLSSNSKISKSINVKKNKTDSFKNFIKQIKTVNGSNKVPNKFQIFFKEKENIKGNNDLNEPAHENKDHKNQHTRKKSKNSSNEKIEHSTPHKSEEIKPEDNFDKIDDENANNSYEKPIINEELGEIKSLDNSLERCCEIKDENKEGVEKIDDHNNNKEDKKTDEENHVNNDPKEEMNHSCNPVPQSINIKEKLKKNKDIIKLAESDKSKAIDVNKNTQNSFDNISPQKKETHQKISQLENFFPNDLEAINNDSINDFNSFTKNNTSSKSLHKESDKLNRNNRSPDKDLSGKHDNSNINRTNIKINEALPSTFSEKNFSNNQAKIDHERNNKSLSSNQGLNQKISKSFIQNKLPLEDENLNKTESPPFKPNKKIGTNNTKDKESTYVKKSRDEKEFNSMELVNKGENKSNSFKTDLIGKNNPHNSNLNEKEISENFPIKLDNSNREKGLDIYTSILKKIIGSFEKMSQTFEKNIEKKLNTLNSKLISLEKKVKERQKCKLIKMTENTIKVQDSVETVDLDKHTIQNNTTSEINSIWTQALQFVKNEQHEEGYKTILTSGIHNLK
jgi:hypothetical protein